MAGVSGSARELVVTDIFLDPVAAQYRRLDMLRSLSRSLLTWNVVLFGAIAVGGALDRSSLDLPFAHWLAVVVLVPLLALLMLWSLVEFGAVASRATLAVLFFVAALAPAIEAPRLAFMLVQNGARTPLPHVAMALLGVLLAIELWVALVALFLASRGQRSFLSEQISFASMVGAPAALSLLAARGVSGRWLFAIAACLNGVAAAFLLWAAIQLLKSPGLAAGDCTQSVSGCVDEFYIRSLPELIGLAMIAALAFASVARWVRSAARARVRKSAAEARALDQRPPIVFLRSFKDDQVEIAESRWTALRFAFGLMRGRAPLDHLLLEEFSQYGPVVAIGRPGEVVPPYGAWRNYVDNTDGEQWKLEVAELVRAASAVVMVIDDTPGVMWEIEHLAAMDHLPKTLFLAPPRIRDAALNATVWRSLSDATGANLGASPGGFPGGVLGLTMPRREQAVLFRSRRFGQSEYLMALRAFFRKAGRASAC